MQEKLEWEIWIYIHTEMLPYVLKIEESYFTTKYDVGISY